MIRNVVLGLLRDGVARHGYELMVEYRRRSGEQMSTGNFYRELSWLVSHGCIETGVNPPDADGRRIPYRITDKGRHMFGQWLLAQDVGAEDAPDRLLFLPLMPADALGRLLHRWQDDLTCEERGLVRARDEALAAGDSHGPAFIRLRMKQVAAELEFVNELARELAEQPRTESPGGSRRPNFPGSRPLDRGRRELVSSGGAACRV
jgi:DNA-binding PadR family transcriptional regulator